MVKKVFPDSKVQYTVYHYTTREIVERILKDGFKPASELTADKYYTNRFDGVYFTHSDKSYWGDDLEQIAVKINIQNPLDISDFPLDEENFNPAQRLLAEKIGRILQVAEDNHDKIMKGRYSAVIMAKEATKAFQAAGYDGLIFEGPAGHIEHVVFDPKQIHIIGTNVERFNVAKDKLVQRVIVPEKLKQQSLEK